MILKKTPYHVRETKIIFQRGREDAVFACVPESVSEVTDPDSGPDPTHLPAIVNKNNSLKHNITDKKF